MRTEHLDVRDRKRSKIKFIFGNLPTLPQNHQHSVAQWNTGPRSEVEKLYFELIFLKRETPLPTKNNIGQDTIKFVKLEQGVGVPTIMDS